MKLDSLNPLTELGTIRKCVDDADADGEAFHQRVELREVHPT